MDVMQALPVRGRPESCVCCFYQAPAVPGEWRAPAALVITAVLSAHALSHELFAGVLAGGLFGAAPAPTLSGSASTLQHVPRALRSVAPGARIGAFEGTHPHLSSTDHFVLHT
jgi:hypothetical protein